MKSSFFWDVTPCILLKVNRHFGRTPCIHLQRRRISQARNSASHLLRAGFLLCLLFVPEDGSEVILRNVCWLLTGYKVLCPRLQNFSEGIYFETLCRSWSFQGTAHCTYIAEFLALSIVRYSEQNTAFRKLNFAVLRRSGEAPTPIAPLEGADLSNRTNDPYSWSARNDVPSHNGRQRRTEGSVWNALQRCVR
jgi:hypothetical protein